MAQPKTVDLKYRPRAWQQELHAAGSKFRFRVCVVHRQGGKALDVDTLIPLAEGGFRRMGDLREGDRVVDERGEPCSVTQAHEVLRDRRCVELEFSDGAKIVCDAEHRWHTQTKLDRANRVGRYAVEVKKRHSGVPERLPGSVKTAAEIEASLVYAGENNHSIHVCAPVNYPAKKQTVPAYILGLWLGDGHSEAPYITTMDEWIRDAFELYAESSGLRFSKMMSCQGPGKASTYGVANGARPGGLTTKLRALGILGSGRKRIPSDYLFGSIEQRKALLAGLMDTDGSITKCGRKCEITFVNKGLSDDLLVLLWGLGLKPVQSTKTVNGAVYWRIKFTPQFNPLRLRHKADRYREPTRTPASMQRFIVAAREVATRPVRCITVDSPSSLFLCGEQCIPTHNSEAACMELIHHAIQATGDLPRFAYVSPELKLARKMFWPKLKQRLQPVIAAGGVDVHEGDLRIQFKSNGATIEMFGASDPESLRGHTMRGVVLDEVGQMPSKLWGTLVEPWIMHNKGWALFIGTPAGVNLFSDLFQRAERGMAGWWGRRWTVYETGALPADEVKRKCDETPENEFAREFLCDFSAQSSEQLISLALATAASQKTWNANAPAIRSAPVVLGVDPARFGDDRSVIVRRQGLFMYPPLVFREVDTVWLARRVAFEIATHKPAAVFVDEGGVGAGVVDVLRQQLGHSVQAVQFGSRAKHPERFINLRTEMWWLMREWLEAGGTIPADPILIRELATPTYGFNGKGQVTLESKEDIKARLDTIDTGGSPDIADALCCTFAAPVSPGGTSIEDDAVRVGMPVREKARYDPFDMRQILAGRGRHR